MPRASCLGAGRIRVMIPYSKLSFLWSSGIQAYFLVGQDETFIAEGNYLFLLRDFTRRAHLVGRVSDFLLDFTHRSVKSERFFVEVRVSKGGSRVRIYELVLT